MSNRWLAPLLTFALTAPILAQGAKPPEFAPAKVTPPPLEAATTSSPSGRLA